MLGEVCRCEDRGDTDEVLRTEVEKSTRGVCVSKESGRRVCCEVSRYVLAGTNGVVVGETKKCCCSRQERNADR